MSRMAMVPTAPMRTGYLFMFNWWWARQPADRSNTEAEQLADAAAAAGRAGVCDVSSPSYDADACAMILNPDIATPQSYSDLAREHYARTTTGGGRCELADFPCYLGLRTLQGEWISPADWPLPAKIAGGVLGVVALGAGVSLVRGIAGLFRSK